MGVKIRQGRNSDLKTGLNCETLKIGPLSHPKQRPFVCDVVLKAILGKSKAKAASHLFFIPSSQNFARIIEEILLKFRKGGKVECMK